MTYVTVTQILIILGTLLCIGGFSFIYNIFKILFLTLTATLGLYFWGKFKHNYILLFILGVVSINYWLIDFSYSQKPNIVSKSRTDLVEGLIINKYIKNNNPYLVLSINALNNKPTNYRGNILVENIDLNDYTRLVIGDYVKVEGKLKNNLKNLLPFELSKQLYLNSQNILFILKSISIEKLNTKLLIYSIYDTIKTKIDNFRESILNNNLQTLPKTEALTLTAIVLGDTAVKIDDKVKTAFTQVGLTHLLAASGFNLSIIIITLNFLLRFIVSNPFVRYLIVVIIAFFYSIMADLSPSILRALMMAVIFLLIKLLSRKPSILSIVFLILIINIIIQPLCILNAGFQLSYLATIGLLFGIRVYKKIKNKLINYILENIFGILFAQIFVFPVIIYNFNQFNVLFIIANLLSAQLVSVISIIGFLSSSLSVLLNIVHELKIINLIIYLAIIFINNIILPLVQLLENIVITLNQLQWAKLQFASPNIWLITTYYLILTLIILIKKNNRLIYLFSGIILVLIILMFNNINFEPCVKIAQFGKFLMISYQKDIAVINGQNNKLVEAENELNSIFNTYRIKRYMQFYHLVPIKNCTRQFDIIESDNNITFNLPYNSTKITVNKLTITVSHKQKNIMFSHKKIINCQLEILPHSQVNNNVFSYFNLCNCKNYYLLND